MIFFCFILHNYCLFGSPNREEAAIRELLTVAKDTRTDGPAEGAHLHIVHLSDASSSLDLLMVSKIYFNVYK